MKNNIYFLILCACGLLLFSGCSMMPDDEEIIRGSVSESEIFDDGELDEQKIVEDEEISSDFEVVEDEESVEDDGDGSSEIDIQVVQ